VKYVHVVFWSHEGSLVTSVLSHQLDLKVKEVVSNLVATILYIVLRVLWNIKLCRCWLPYDINICGDVYVNQISQWEI